MITYESHKGASAIAKLLPGQLVAEVTDNGHDRRFYPVSAVADETAASMIFPAISEVHQVADPQGDPTGPVSLRLQAGLHDHVSVMSPLHFVLDRDAVVITASGVFDG